MTVYDRMRGAVTPLLLRLLTLCCLVRAGCAGNPDAKRLYDDLLSNYNKLVRPVVNVTDPLKVKIKLKLSQLIDVVSTCGKGRPMYGVKLEGRCSINCVLIFVYVSLLETVQMDGSYIYDVCFERLLLYRNLQLSKLPIEDV